MVILYVHNLRKKAFVLMILIAVWAAMYFFTDYIVNNMPVSTITVEDLFTFSYPPLLVAEKIYINETYANEQNNENVITVSANMVKPVMQNFSSYIFLKGKLTFDYPSIFTLSEKEFQDGDILYHIDFSDNQGIIHGFVQVWKMPYSLKEFLDKSIENSTQVYESFKYEEKDIGDKRGYLWDYTVFSGNDNTYYKGMEFFFKKRDFMYRISYFVPKKEWDKTKESIFWRMVESFTVY